MAIYRPSTWQLKDLNTGQFITKDMATYDLNMQRYLDLNTWQFIDHLYTKSKYN